MYQHASFVVSIVLTVASLLDPTRLHNVWALWEYFVRCKLCRGVSSCNGTLVRFDPYIPSFFIYKSLRGTSLLWNPGNAVHLSKLFDVEHHDPPIACQTKDGLRGLKKYFTVLKSCIFVHLPKQFDDDDCSACCMSSETWRRRTCSLLLITLLRSFSRITKGHQSALHDTQYGNHLRSKNGSVTTHVWELKTMMMTFLLSLPVFNQQLFELWTPTPGAFSPNSYATFSPGKRALVSRMQQPSWSAMVRLIAGNSRGMTLVEWRIISLTAKQ